MKLEHLSLRPIYSYEAGYDKDRLQYIGEIKYSTTSGAIQCRVGPEAATRIIAIVADELVQESKRIANDLTAEVLTQAALPAPAEA